MEGGEGDMVVGYTAGIRRKKGLGIFWVGLWVVWRGLDMNGRCY